MARQGKEAVTTQAGEQKDKAKPQELNGMERRAAERHQIETKVIIHRRMASRFPPPPSTSAARACSCAWNGRTLSISTKR